MLIRYQDGRTVDYGVFALKAPYYDCVDAVESSISHTNESGNIPAVMTIVLKDGTVLHTNKFIVIYPYNSEFRIIDRELYRIILKMMEEKGIYGDILDLILLHTEDWSIYVHYYDGMDDWEDGAYTLDVKNVSWSAIGLNP